MLQATCLLVLLAQLVFTSLAVAAGSQNLKIEIEGNTRLAKLVENSVGADNSQPVVFAFHGYDDSARNFSRYVDLHKSWPRAIIVYPQGLQIPDSKGTLRAKGWQSSAGMLGDRDLRFVDVLIKELESRYQIDQRRIYATGMSNGGQFAFLLMSERSHRFAAFAPVGIEASKQVLENMTVPKPVIYMIGREEPQWRLLDAQLTVEAISRINRSTREQEMWAENFLLFKPAEGGADFVFNLHQAGHVWPFGASDMIMRFFPGTPTGN